MGNCFIGIDYRRDVVSSQIWVFRFPVKLQQTKDMEARLWFMQTTIEQGWSRNVLQLMINSNAYERQGKAINNFDIRLLSLQSDLARQALKDPYIFDFMTIEEPLRERGLEAGLIKHLEKFLLELGSGSAFFTF